MTGTIFCYWAEKYCSMGVEILSNYLHRKERNISLLMDFAKQMRVISTIQPYLEMGLYSL